MPTNNICQERPGNKYPYLDREAAFRVASEMEDDLGAIADFAQVLMDISASDHIQSGQRNAIYRVAMTILHHMRNLSEFHGMLFYGLHSSKQPTETFSKPENEGIKAA